MRGYKGVNIYKGVDTYDGVNICHFHSYNTNCHQVCIQLALSMSTLSVHSISIEHVHTECAFN